MGIFEPNIEKLKARKNVEGLIKALKDRRVDVRYYAAEALGKIGDNRAVELLIEALEDCDSDVRKRAAWALDQLGWTPKDDSENTRYFIAKREWVKLARLGKPAVDPLIEALKDRDGAVRMNTAWALGKTGDERAIEPLLGALKRNDENVNVTCNAIEALTKMWDEKAVESFVHFLRYRGWDFELILKVRTEFTGGMIESTYYYSEEDMIKQSNLDRIHYTAAKALRKIERPELKPLIQALECGQEKDIKLRIIRGAAAWALGERSVDAVVALGEIGGRRAVGPLISALKDKNYNVRLNAAEALGKIGDKKAIGPLKEVLKDKSWQVRTSAQESLNKINSNT